jgi:ricin-type beta-trefoil lectin protein
MTPRITGRRFVSAITLAGAAMLALTIPATAATTPTAQPHTATAHVTALSGLTLKTLKTDGTDFVYIENKDGKCLDMTGGSTAAGAQPQLWTCNHDAQQIWESIPLYGGTKFMLLMNENSGLCLSIKNNDPNPGAEVIQWSCNYTGTDYYEVWYLTSPYGPDTTTQEGNSIMNDGSDNCTCGMHPSGDSSADGTKIFINRVNPIETDYLWDFTNV